jgi:hypothetical protein
MAYGQGAVTMVVPTNFRVLKPSKRKPVPGDIFAMQLPDSSYLMGRVISTTARIYSGGGNLVMLYVFKTRFNRKEVPNRSALRTENLLLPPKLTNYLGWVRGYFETIASFPLEEGEVLPTHCFYDPLYRKYFDESNNELPGPIEPVGDYVLDSYRTIDDAVSDAIGIPQAPIPKRPRSSKWVVSIPVGGPQDLERLFLLETELSGEGVIFDTSYSKAEGCKYWHLDEVRGPLSQKEIVRRLKEAGFEPARG